MRPSRFAWMAHIFVCSKKLSDLAQQSWTPCWEHFIFKVWAKFDSFLPELFTAYKNLSRLRKTKRSPWMGMMINEHNLPASLWPLMPIFNKTSTARTRAVYCTPTNLGYKMMIICYGQSLRISTVPYQFQVTIIFSDMTIGYISMALKRKNVV